MWVLQIYVGVQKGRPYLISEVQIPRFAEDFYFPRDVVNPSFLGNLPGLVSLLVSYKINILGNLPLGYLIRGAMGSMSNSCQTHGFHPQDAPFDVGPIALEENAENKTAALGGWLVEHIGHD